MGKVWAKQKRAGFTIVELLIVIVVIAILATISVSAFNGMQARTRNVQRIASVGEYVKILKLYAATYGKYPMAGLNDYTCLGENYPDLDGDGQGDCFEVINGTYTYHPSAAVNAEMKKVVSTLPNYNKTPVKSADGKSYMGVAIIGDVRINNGQNFKYTLMYYLEGTKQNCGNSNVIEETGVWPNYKSSTTGYTYTTSTDTKCYLYLPDV